MTLMQVPQSKLWFAFVYVILMSDRCSFLHQLLYVISFQGYKSLCLFDLCQAITILTCQW